MTKPICKKPHSPEFKFKVALAALEGEKTVAEICQTYNIVSSQLYKWKNEVLNNGHEVFNNSQSTSAHNHQNEIDKLHATIGKLKVENDFLERCARRFQ